MNNQKNKTTNVNKIKQKIQNKNKPRGSYFLRGEGGKRVFFLLKGV